MKKLLLIILLLFTTSNAYSDKLPDIVATVNDKPITAYEFNARKNMIIKLNNVDIDNAMMNKKINQDVLNMLIEEALLNQHSKKVGATISEAAIQNAIATIEERNKMPKGELVKYLQNQGVNITTFKDQVQGELIKYNILSSLSGSVSVSPKAVNKALVEEAKKDLEVEAWVFYSKDSNKKMYDAMVRFKKRLSSCDKVSDKLYNSFADAEKFDRKLSQFDDKLQSVVKDTKVGASSNIYLEDNKFTFALVCKKEPINVSSTEMDNLKLYLSNKEMSKKADKFFKDLRTKAEIQIMLP